MIFNGRFLELNTYARTKVQWEFLKILLIAIKLKKVKICFWNYVAHGYTVKIHNKFLQQECLVTEVNKQRGRSITNRWSTKNTYLPVWFCKILILLSILRNKTSAGLRVPWTQGNLIAASVQHILIIYSAYSAYLIGYLLIECSFLAHPFHEAFFSSKATKYTSDLCNMVRTQSIILGVYHCLLLNF